MSPGIPLDTYGEEIVRRYQANPEKLIEYLLINRKMDAPQYIQIKLLMSVSKTLNELIRDTKELLKKLNSRTQVGSG